MTSTVSLSGRLAAGAAAFLLAPVLCSAALTNRWSFNGDLTDSVGGRTAQLLDADNNPATGGGAVFEPNQIRLQGGDNLSSTYIELGPNIFGTGNMVTFEIWATQDAVQNWSRIFDIGSDATPTNDAGDTFIMSWTRGTAINQDRIEYRMSNTAPGGVQGMLVDDTNAPYTFGQEYHIVLSMDNRTANSTVVSWWSAPSNAGDLGPMKGSFTSTIDLNEFRDNTAWLGRSHWAGDATASASYNEFRVYDHLLSVNERELSHDRGPNVIPEPSAFALAGMCGVALILRRRRR